MAEMENAVVVEGDSDKMGLIGAIYLGVGSMVGAGIFALFGQAGSIAGAAVWISFLLGGIIALMQGYSFAKLGQRYPSSGGIIDWIVRCFGKGLFSGGIVMLGFFSVIATTAMVALSFGSYTSLLFLGEGAPLWVAKLLASVVVLVLAFVNLYGADAATRAQTFVVSIVLAVLIAFAIAMLFNLNPSLLAPSNYPPTRNIVASVALTFFAYLGFGVIAFTGGDLKDPTKNMPRAMYISLIFVAILYVALAIGVFGVLTVDQVIASADTALAVAAEPIFGQIGFLLVTIAAIFATAGCINGQLYASIGASYAMARDGELPPAFGLRRRKHALGTEGMIISALLIIILAVLFDVAQIAAIGSAVSLAIFVLLTIGHLRIADQTQASRAMLYVALVATSIAVVVFAVYTLFTDPRMFVTLVVVTALAWVLEAVLQRWGKRDVRIAARSEPHP